MGGQHFTISSLALFSKLFAELPKRPRGTDCSVVSRAIHWFFLECLAEGWRGRWTGDSCKPRYRGSCRSAPSLLCGLFFVFSCPKKWSRSVALGRCMGGSVGCCSGAAILLALQLLPCLRLGAESACEFCSRFLIGKGPHEGLGFLTVALSHCAQIQM